MNDTILAVLILAPCIIVAIVFHEVAHGWAALALGDPTAKEQRRLTFNPLRHVDPFGTVILPGLLAATGAPVFGWAKPVPVNFRRLDNPRIGMMLVAAAGPGMNFALATLAAIVLGLTAGNPLLVQGEGQMLLASGLYTFILMNLFLGLFNLLPIPPFDGSHIVEGMLPDRAARVYSRLRPYGFPLLFVLLLVVPMVFPNANLIERIVMPPVMWAEGLLASFAMMIAAL